MSRDNVWKASLSAALFLVWLLWTYFMFRFASSSLWVLFSFGGGIVLAISALWIWFGRRSG
jgi:hypothetical protein